MSRKKSVAVLFVGLLIGCANPGTPTGGDRDEAPPKITSVNPENYSVSFNKNRIAIAFDEFVKLENASKNVVISPPQKKAPKVTLRERSIVVDLRDTLRANTTYVIDFGKAIVDNNEGNPLGEYRYVFSTGTKIDEMGLAGYVKGAKVDTAAQIAKVALYVPSDTLNPYRILPEYLAQTDSLGFFMFSNIRDADYKIIAFQDKNGNNMLDVDEPLAFYPETVHTSVTEGAKDDSLQLDKYTKFKNTSLQLRMFQPTASQQYLTEYKRPLREQLTFAFSAPRKDSLQISLVNTVEKPEFVIEESAQKDSLIYWIMNEKLSQKDTLLASVSYLRTDSLGKLSPFSDTLKFVYKTKKKKRKKRKKDEEEKTIDFMTIKTNMSGKINDFDALTLSFERPIQKELKKEDIFFFTKLDTVEVAKDFSLQKDSVLPHRKYHLITSLERGAIYNLRIDSMKIVDTGNRPNKQLETSFETHPSSYYGKLFVSITGVEENVLIELANKRKPDEVVAQQKCQGNKKLVFENLPPATYILRALWDTNNNGKWDVGDYEKQLQPEHTQIFKKEIELRSNWESEVAWTLKGLKKKKNGKNEKSKNRVD